MCRLELLRIWTECVSRSELHIDTYIGKQSHKSKISSFSPRTERKNNNSREEKETTIANDERALALLDTYAFSFFSSFYPFHILPSHAPRTPTYTHDSSPPSFSRPPNTTQHALAPPYFLPAPAAGVESRPSKKLRTPPPPPPPAAPPGAEAAAASFLCMCVHIVYLCVRSWGQYNK